MRRRCGSDVDRRGRRGLRPRSPCAPRRSGCRAPLLARAGRRRARRRVGTTSVRACRSSTPRPDRSPRPMPCRRVRPAGGPVAGNAGACSSSRRSDPCAARLSLACCITSTASGESRPAKGRPDSTPTVVSLCPKMRSRNVSCEKHSFGSDAPHAACGKFRPKSPQLRAGSRKCSCTSITKSPRSSTLDAAAGSIVVVPLVVDVVPATSKLPPGAEVPLAARSSLRARAQRREHRGGRGGRHEQVASRHRADCARAGPSPRGLAGRLRPRPADGGIGSYSSLDRGPRSSGRM